jgi:hypothetical protein
MPMVYGGIVRVLVTAPGGAEMLMAFRGVVDGV